MSCMPLKAAVACLSSSSRVIPNVSSVHRATLVAPLRSGAAAAAALVASTSPPVRTRREHLRVGNGFGNDELECGVGSISGDGSGRHVGLASVFDDGSKRVERHVNVCSLELAGNELERIGETSAGGAPPEVSGHVQTTGCERCILKLFHRVGLSEKGIDSLSSNTGKLIKEVDGLATQATERVSSHRDAHFIDERGGNTVCVPWTIGSSGVSSSISVGDSRKIDDDVHAVDEIEHSGELKLAANCGIAL